ncbi:uroporphyrinogen-III C-methyltransferase [Alkalicoccus halolimnae]|uniref:Uroporphyrinogen-III C-methyltransferase n=1 Tax=Alkalicoccus halolimnae TaxID=1667239 RepID=A0A5C7F956_9BACI|nr:uroporphyrinogen-III C-methyltransferase [Alkalicoccus halolimnae]TXF86140.1 uroporphyrinogen-III C-methyltransferase [Alkalicoccus halolimnae]
MKGFVSFVGAGPGDVELITAKGLRRLRKADVVLYDRLVNPRLLRFTKETCEFIYCGKLPTKHVMPQETINKTLKDKALAGHQVVRLKGGDPAVFGRVGEEASALKRKEVEYEIVPGITSSLAAASYAGIPVTHRNHSASITLRTGHSVEKSSTVPQDKEGHGDTIAYYMGVKNLGYHCEELVKDGFSPDTKAAVIEWATTGKQRTVTGTITTIEEEVKKTGIQNPAMTIIGDVVGLREELQWFEAKRLFGKRILVAKSSSAESSLEQHFLELGAEAYAFPALKLEKKNLASTSLQSVKKADALLFQSPESVTILLEQFYAEGFDVRDLPRNIYCLSEKTKRVLQNAGLKSEKINESGEGMLVVGYEKEEISSPGGEILTTHAVKLDNRFRIIDERMLEEEWETVVFPSAASVDWFLHVRNLYGMLNLSHLRFACLGETVKKYAQAHGFSILDEQVQQELEMWKNSSFHPVR